jgi:hypothetical protein
VIEADEVRAAMAAVRDELGRLDGRLGDADGLLQLPAAQALVKLDKVRADLVKIGAALADGQPPDPGPTLPGFDPDAGDGQGGGKKRRRR